MRKSNEIFILDSVKDVLEHETGLSRKAIISNLKMMANESLLETQTVLLLSEKHPTVVINAEGLKKIEYVFSQKIKKHLRDISRLIVSVNPVVSVPNPKEIKAMQDTEKKRLKIEKKVDAEINKKLSAGQIKLLTKKYKHFLNSLMINKTKNKKNKMIKRKQEKSFVQAKQIFEALELSFTTGQNIILYGKGGHAKSEIASEFFSLKSLEPFVQSFSTQTPEEKIFGGINIKKMKETGEIEYLTSKSFAEWEFVIFEELFDAPAQTLCALKDVLTSKHIRNGHQQVPVKTRQIVVCTNKSAEEIVEDASTAALLERFPIRIRVEWDDYSPYSFTQMFDTVYESVEDTYNRQSVANICAASIERGEFVSPRTACKIYEAVETMNSLEVVNFYEDVNKEVVADYIQNHANDTIRREQEKTLRSIETLADETVTKANMENKFKTYIKTIKELKALLSELENIVYHDSVVDIYHESKDEINNYISYMKERLIEVAENEETE